MGDSKYPDYVPPEVIAAYESTLETWGEDGENIAKRLVFRPCMEKVYRDLGKALNGLPEADGPSGSRMTPWAWAFEIMVTMVDEHNWIVQNLKPARKELQKKMDSIQAAGAQLIKDMTWAFNGSIQGPNYHGLSVPEEFGLVGVIEKIVKAAANWSPDSAVDEYTEMVGQQVPKKTTPEIHYAKSVLFMLQSACDDEVYGFPPSKTFSLKNILSYDNYARITRAALDLPDYINQYRKPLIGEDLRQAFSAPRRIARDM